LHENDTYIRPQDFPVVDDLLDWLIDKQRQGWKMVDSIPRLQNMKGSCAVPASTGDVERDRTG